MSTSATINLWGSRVGVVVWDERTNSAVFEYDRDFTRKSIELAPFQMPISLLGTNNIFSFPELSRSQTFKGLPGLLADALPDSYGNSIINSWLSSDGRAVQSINPIEKLCFLGTTAMGALEFEPSTYPTSNEATVLEIKDLLAFTNKLISSKKSLNAHLANEDEQKMMNVLKVGSAAGGARAKAIIAYNEKTGEIRSGQTGAPDGYEHWLIKFDGIMDDQFGASNGYGKVEMAYHWMAMDAGIIMMESRILEENGRAHFMTKRFDRRGKEEKVHMQSFCALRHFDFNEVGYYSYEQLFETMRAMHLPYNQHDQLYRRMVFNVLARNCDDHTKNFSFLLNQNSHWQLSPAYDVCHAYRPNSQWVTRHSLSINGKTEHISQKDLKDIAAAMDIKGAQSIIDHIAAVVADWQGYAEKATVDEELAKAIEETLLPEFQEYRKNKHSRRLGRLR